MSHPLLGTPILKKLIKENDLELFSYDETFSHIVPNGKEVFTTLAELSNKDFKELPLPIDQEDLPKETILKAIDTACLALNITIPKITIKQSDTPSDEPLPEALNTAIRLANSGLKQGSETLAFAIKEGNQPIVERLLKHPLLCHNYEAHAHALFAAATANDGERVHSLLADPTTLGRYSLWYRALALIEAAKNGHLQLTLDLFKPELVTQYLNKLVNAFHRAAEGGHLEIVRELLKIDLVKEHATDIDNHALVRSAALGHFEVVQELLKIDKVREHKNTIRVLIFAAYHGRLDIVCELLKIKKIISKVDFNHNSALTEAARNGHLAIVRELLKIEKVKETADYHLALQSAAMNGHLNVVLELLTIKKAREEITDLDNNVLRKAAASGHLDIVQALLEIPEVKKHEVDRYISPWTRKWFIEKVNPWIFNKILQISPQPLKSLIQKIGQFLKIKGDTTDDKTSALIPAATCGHIAVVRELLKIDAIKKQAHAGNNAALRYAAKNGHLAVVQKLLKIDAVKKQAHTGNNAALIDAAKNGHLAVVQELLKIDAIKKQAHAANNVALGFAASNGHLAVVQELLKIPSVKANAAIDNNWVLREAAKYGQIDIMLELLATPTVKGAAHNVTGIIWVLKNKLFKLLTIKIPLALSNSSPYLATLIKAVEKEKCPVAVVRELLALPIVRTEIAEAAEDDLLILIRQAAKNGHTEILRELLEIERINKHAADQDNKALVYAIKNGHLEIVRELLKIPAVKNLAADDNNAELYIATNYGHLNIVRELLKITAVKDNAATLENKILERAAFRGYLEVVQELLAIESVRSNAAARHNSILMEAAENGHLDVVRELLKIPQVAKDIAIDQNAILKSAARKGEALIVKELLQYPDVIKKITVHNNAVLRYAIENRHADVINDLLLFKAVREKLTLEMIFKLLSLPFVNHTLIEEDVIKQFIETQCLSKQELLVLTNKLKPSDHRALSILKQYLKYYNYLPIQEGLDGAELISALKSSIENSFSDYFETPQAHAGKLLQGIANVTYLKRKHNEYAGLEGNVESAMEESLVQEAVRRFKEEVEPAFEQQFTQMGGIDGIEPKIIELLLNQKVAQLKQAPTQNSKAINFIEQNKTALIKREPAALLKSRKYFNSNTDTVDIAFRAFDPDAPSTGWAKLFVAPKPEKANSKVFSTRASSPVALTLKQTTNITRKILCYTYVLAQDPSLSAELRNTISQALVSYLAEICRAHNNDTIEADNGSCFPGTLTRLDLIIQRHPRFYVPKELFKTTKEIASQLILKAFDTELKNACSDPDKKRDLYEALISFSHENARDILHNLKDVLTLSEEHEKSAKLEKLLAIRKMFFDTHFGKKGEKGIAAINEKLIPHNLAIVDEMKEIALIPLINMNKATSTTNFSLLEAYCQSRSAEEKVERDKKLNPFKPNYIKISKLLNSIPDKDKFIALKYKESAIRAAYYDWCASNFEKLTVDQLHEKVEMAYQNAKDKVLADYEARKLVFDSTQWDPYESIIKILMSISNCERENFPTEARIQAEIAQAKRELEKSDCALKNNDDNENTKNNAAPLLYCAGRETQAPVENNLPINEEQVVLPKKTLKMSR